MSSYGVYPKYKDSGVAWLGSIPEHWEARKLKTLARCFPSNVDKHIHGGEQLIRLCNYTDVYKNDIISNSMRFKQASATLEEIEKFALFEGDVLITKDSETADDIAVPAYVSENLIGTICGYHLSIIRPTVEVFGKFLFRLFQDDRFNSQFLLNAQGVTRVGLSVYDINNVIGVLPPLTEQEAIARFLDYKVGKIDRFIRKKKQLVKLLSEQKAAIINAAVTKGLDQTVPMKDSGIEWLGEVPAHWEVRKLKYLAKFVGGGTPSKAESAYWENGNIPWVTPKDMKSDHISESQEMITELGLQNSPCTLVPAESILLVVRSGILQRTIPIAINKVPVVVNQDQKAIFLNHKFLSSEYFMYWVKGMTNVLLVEWTKKGATVESIEQEYLANSMLPVPPTIEQEGIVAFINNETATINTTIATIQKEIALTEEYRTALIAEAVTGKIDVRGYAVPEEDQAEPMHYSLDDEDADFLMAAEDEAEYGNEENE